jgi:DNA-binding response OmpR family regulator
MSKKRNKIMITDDDPEIVDMLTLMLEDAGYEVNVTVNGQTYNDVKENLPELVLLDVWMSGADGSEICLWLKKQQKTKHIPVIMISANKDVRNIALKAGADDFIAKPFEMNVLLKKVAKYLPYKLIIPMRN